MNQLQKYMNFFALAGYTPKTQKVYARHILRAAKHSGAESEHITDDQVKNYLKN